MKQKRLYDTTRWRKASRLFLDAHPLCIMCSRIGRDTTATVVDHIHKHNGDPVMFWDESNWQALCYSCHSGSKRQQENTGYSQAVDVHGFPVDDQHPWNKGVGGG